MEQIQPFAQTWTGCTLIDILKLSIEINQKTDFWVDFWLTGIGNSIEVRVNKAKKIGSEKLFSSHIILFSQDDWPIDETWKVLSYISTFNSFPNVQELWGKD